MIQTSFQRGNALFLILIAVALFAALSYAITSSTRGGGSIAKEQATIDTAVSQQCAAMVENGAQRLALFNGCDTAELSYELPDGTNANASAPADRSCHLFAEEGAGLSACGDYLVATGFPVGSITFGDTTTATLLSNGTHFRCNSYGSQYGSYGICTDWEYSIDNTNFLTDNICYARDSAELTARGQNTPPREFGMMICSAACGDTSIANAVTISGTGWSGSGYYYGTDQSITPYTGACTRHFDTSESGAGAFDCNCWGSS